MQWACRHVQVTHAEKEINNMSNVDSNWSGDGYFGWGSRLRRYKEWGLERRKLSKPLKQEKGLSLFSKNKKPV